MRHYYCRHMPLLPLRHAEDAAAATSVITLLLLLLTLPLLRWPYATIDAAATYERR